MNRSKLFWSFVSGLLSCVFLVDLLSWFVTGLGLGQVIAGANAPLIIAIAEHIMFIPEWAFYLVCAFSVIVLSVILSLCIVCSFHPGGTFSFKGRMIR